jgi:hypothetical protein
VFARDELPKNEFGEPDFCGRLGAAALKAKIEAYWRERGYAVEVSTHNTGFHPTMRSARTDVRSNMRNGYPILRAVPSREQR